MLSIFALFFKVILDLILFASLFILILDLRSDIFQGNLLCYVLEKEVKTEEVIRTAKGTIFRNVYVLRLRNEKKERFNGNEVPIHPQIGGPFKVYRTLVRPLLIKHERILALFINKNGTSMSNRR